MKCSVCEREINERIEKVWVKVTGWEAKREQGGTNHIALREQLNEFMCVGCMTLTQAGLNPGQSSLI